MKRILFLLFAIGLSASMTMMASMSTSKVRKETRFLTDKMAYELDLNTQQYNDIYEINYDFIYSVRNIMDYVVRGDEWAVNDYYEALDIRNDDLRWVLNNSQYRRFMGADYFYRPIYVTGGRWNFRIYINYPNRGLFYFGVPYHYRTYCGAHFRPHLHHVSYYRGRYNDFGHYPTPHRVRDQRVFHSYRRSDFGSVHFRPNTSVRPHNVPTRPGVSERPGGSNHQRPESGHRPSAPSRPSTSNRPSPSERPSTSGRPSTSNRPSPSERPSTSGRPSTSNRPSPSERPSTSGRPSTSNRPSPSERPSTSSRPSTPSRGESSRKDVVPNRSENNKERPTTTTNRENNRGSSSSRGTSRENVSKGSTERRSSNQSTRSNSSRGSSRSSERENSTRR
ncbi:hypothetical protein [Bacteroides sp.]|uniref:hypothetical protein n=1 Tax=Bacteroides sp. TaxID=29523 RepID=UPI00261AEAF7|nr:hypothetical protein [Bacteroides sp.]MDD3040603.1 hypothetical protein [Bacteroides sp.]